MAILQNPTFNYPSSLYERDFYQWLMITIKLLQDRSFEQIDLDNLIKELEGTARRTQNTLKSNLRVLLMNLLQYQYQPSVRSESYQSIVIKHRLRLQEIFSDCPSLKFYVAEVFDECYGHGRQLAASQTNLPLEIFPEICPFTQEQILNIDYWPE
ncbi:DUF29 domain-containing protein [Gloeothece verrucosa]|uniref:DUF29 domain-containing protein n=1 Tax=Gloeothece verrucosa (strain PCC 7822) TaxID=497965 RepID=E0UJP8_GLOV7|nr:DUF29 domain-containing protein [Gloeothece verrucosa]ADN12292.1 protein of unknown function DUF29 [Gloeothece verrucosa PCC 7822]